MANEMYTTAENNLVTKSQMSRVREVDFVSQFAHNSLAKLIEVLGVTRKIPMQEGTTMYMYTTSGTLQSGSVSEGAVIPLSQYARNKAAVGEITLKKWRKAVSAESIMKSGYDEAVRETDAALLRDVQKTVRGDFFTLLNGAIANSTTVVEETLQAALAEAWAQLQIKFEDDTAQPVHFLNPLDIGDYLKTANITVQNAFGMNYIQDFLGLGTVILSSHVTQGTFVSTAKENIVLYYLTMGGDIAGQFGLTVDDLGYIGIKTDIPTEQRAQLETLVMSGIQFFVEYAAGVIKGQISGVLPRITVTSVAGTDAGDTKITTDYSLGTGESFVYKVTDDPIIVRKGDSTSAWTSWNGSADITAATGKIITVAVSKSSAVVAAGNATVTAKAGG